MQPAAGTPAVVYTAGQPAACWACMYSVRIGFIVCLAASAGAALFAQQPVWYPLPGLWCYTDHHGAGSWPVAAGVVL